MLAKECARLDRASLLSLCWVSTWQRLRFTAAAKVPLRARERERLLLHMYTQQRARNLAFVIRKRTKNMTSISVGGNLCRALLGRGYSPSVYPLMTRPMLPTPGYNPEFHVDRTHTAGGVIEQTETALRKYS